MVGHGSTPCPTLFQRSSTKTQVGSDSQGLRIASDLPTRESRFGLVRLPARNVDMVRGARDPGQTMLAVLRNCTGAGFLLRRPCCFLIPA